MLSALRAVTSFRRMLERLSNLELHSTAKTASVDHDLAPRGCFDVARKTSTMCRLTFEVSGRQRRGAEPALQKMRYCTVARAWRNAVGAPLDRGVRRSCEFWVGWWRDAVVFAVRCKRTTIRAAVRKVDATAGVGMPQVGRHDKTAGPCRLLRLNHRLWHGIGNAPQRLQSSFLAGEQERSA